MESLASSTAPTGRRYSSKKGPIFWLGLVLAATLSIARSFFYSSGDGGSGESRPDDPEYSQFAPSRLKEVPRNLHQKDPNDEPVKVDKPLNIVMLYADDWRHDSLGVASNGKVVTPFLDWLATKQGIRFTHNCVTTSVCWISRATLHTGQYYSRHKATRPKDNEWYEGFADTYPVLLRNASYYVGHIGKWHSADFGKIKHHYHHQKTYYGRHWFPGNPRPIHVTERNEKDGLEFLKTRPQDKPFVLTLAFFAPHSWDGHPDQYLPQPKTQDVYDNSTFAPPYDMEKSFKRLPKFFSEKNEGRHRYRQRFTDGLYGPVTAR